MRKPIEFSGHFHALTTMEYRGVVRHVVDGDTLDVLVDLGCRQYSYLTVRVKDVDTPELFASNPEERAQAVRAKAFTIEEVMGRHVLVRTYKDSQTFGRYLAEVLYQGGPGTLVSLADRLRAGGHSR